MNERITKIVIDTLGKEGVIANRALGYWALSDEELENFAELIVRECIEMSTGQNQYKLGFQLAKEFKEHFGVE